MTLPMQEEVPTSVTPTGSSNTAAAVATPNSLKRPNKKTKKTTAAPSENFELEDNDNWPDVDVGNLIIDLDADIDKSAMSSAASSSSTSMAGSGSATTQVASTTSANPSPKTTVATVVSTSSMAPMNVTTSSASMSSMGGGGGIPVSSSSTTSKLKTLVTNTNSNSSSSATQTLTETTTLTSSGSGSLNSSSATSSTSPSSSSASDKEKGLKMKIKRTKQGSRHPEGKLEIVPNKDHRDGSGAAAAATSASSSGGTAAATTAAGTSPSSAASSTEASTNVNGNNSFVPGDPTMMSAADIVGRAKAAAVKVEGDKYRLKGDNEAKAASSATQTQSSNNNNSAVATTSKQPRVNDKQTNGRTGATDPKGSSSKKTKSTSSATEVAGNGAPSAKRQKVDVGTGTEMATMTEPDCLGPLDPGTTVSLEGIVWNETDGVLVINVTWRGKTYVGTLLDSTRHVNQWAPPRYSDSPTSEMESRSTKRGSKRGGRGSGTPVETETTRKNLRSNSKSKTSRTGGSGNSSLNSPAKRKGRGSDEDEKSGDGKRKRTDSSRNSPDDDEDSEKDTKGGNDSDSATSSIKGKDDKDDYDMMPKDEEEKRYIPPPPLPYALQCPKPSCKKRYRQHNGLRFHVSHAHPELLDEVGNIRDTSEIERMEKEAKERLNAKDPAAAATAAAAGEANGNNSEASDSSNSGSSSKTATPVPSEAVPVSSSSSSATTASEAAAAVAAISVPLPPSSLKGPPLDAKPIPVTAIEGGMLSNARPPPPVLQTTALPLVSRPPGLVPQAHVKPIRPPVNARPIVPATGPQIMPGGGSLGPSAINLKPIQPRPTIMASPIPTLDLDDLKKAKKPKKSSGSPGNSPPRVGLNGNSPKMPHSISNIKDNQNSNVDPPAKSPAYSDISDDEMSDRNKKSNAALIAAAAHAAAMASPGSQQQPRPSPISAGLTTPNAPAGGGPSGSGPAPPPPPSSAPPGPYAGIPHFGLPPQASLPTIPVSPAQQQQQPQPAHMAQPAAMHREKEKKDMVTGPLPGTIEYEKMLLAYGFPPFPYPIPSGMEPAMHLHMLTTDPVYKAKYEKDRAEKEKAFKEQIDRDNREKDRKAGVKLPEEREAEAQALALQNKKSMISVKPEFRTDHMKKEQVHQHQPPVNVKPQPPSDTSMPAPASAPPPPPPVSASKKEDEGIKATMETRGPPPATPTSFASLMHPGMMGAMRPPFGYDPNMLAAAQATGMPPHLLASLYGQAAGNPYAGMHGLRSPFPPSAASAADDPGRLAALQMQALSQLAGIGGSPSSKSGTSALDELQRQAMSYYAASIGASSGAAGQTVTSSSSSSPSSHKIHELQERALKSPVTNRGSANASPNVSIIGSKSSGGIHSSPLTTMAGSTTPKPSMASSHSGSDLLSHKRTPSPSSRTTPTGSRSRSPPPLRHVHTHTHTHFGLGGYPLVPGGLPGLPGVTGPPAAHTPFPPSGFGSHLLPGKPPLPGALPSFPPPPK